MGANRSIAPWLEDDRAPAITIEALQRAAVVGHDKAGNGAALRTLERAVDRIVLIAVALFIHLRKRRRMRDGQSSGHVDKDLPEFAPGKQGLSSLLQQEQRLLDELSPAGIAGLEGEERRGREIDGVADQLRLGFRQL